MSYQTLDLHHEANALRITLNRPKVLNALSLELLGELAQALKEASEDADIRAVMLTGAGRGFCAGADLANTDLKLGIGEIVKTYYNPVVQQLSTMPKPVIAAVNGVAAGAGMSLALACDMRLLSTGAAFALGFTGIGLVMDASCSYYLPRLVGRGRTFEMAYSGRKISAEEALQLGLGESLLPSEDFDGAAWRYVKAIASGPTKAFGFLKEELNASEGNDLEAQLVTEARLQQAASETDDLHEGMAAFAEKRKPEFKGR